MTTKKIGGHKKKKKLKFQSSVSFRHSLARKVPRTGRDREIREEDLRTPGAGVSCLGFTLWNTNTHDSCSLSLSLTHTHTHTHTHNQQLLLTCSYSPTTPHPGTKHRVPYELELALASHLSPVHLHSAKPNRPFPTICVRKHQKNDEAPISHRW